VIDMPPSKIESRSFDAVVVGAGFSGLYLLHRLRSAGFSAIVLEAAPGVGGTWFWNRYPGARCDIASVEYSYSFDKELEQEWNWTERYAAQPEILRYIEHVAERFDLKRDIRFGTRVQSATWNADAGRWHVVAEDGFALDARFCIMATGCLSNSRIPELPGLGDFQGPVIHTGDWPHEPQDFTGKRVAVIGTGSSGIQVIPEIAKQAQRLTVFQRTPHFSVPAGNHPLDNEYIEQVKATYPERRQYIRNSRNGATYEYATSAALATPREVVQAEFERRWKIGGANFMHAYNDLGRVQEANELAAQFVRDKIAATVKNPDTARMLTPTTYPIGTKRICLDTDYYQTYNRDNVELVDLLEEPLDRITADAVRTRQREIPIDVLVCATGFDAMTGALLAMDIRTSDGTSLRTAWSEGPRNYLGLMVAGFPNLFTVTGPGSPSVLSNMLVSIEQHVEWITDCLGHLRQHGIGTIEASEEAQDAWVDHVREIANTTLYPRAASWYMGANIPGKPRIFMPYIGGVGNYRKKCEEIAAAGYRGFVLKPARERAGVV
jgi:cyclohexanone monooxygenase